MHKIGCINDPRAPLLRVPDDTRGASRSGAGANPNGLAKPPTRSPA